MNGFKNWLRRFLGIEQDIDSIISLHRYSVDLYLDGVVSRVEALESEISNLQDEVDTLSGDLYTINNKVDQKTDADKAITTINNVLDDIYI